MAKKIKLTLYEGDIVDGYAVNEFVAIYKTSQNLWKTVHIATKNTLQGEAKFKKKADCLKYAQYLADNLEMDFTEADQFLVLNSKKDVHKIQKKAMENV